MSFWLGLAGSTRRVTPGFSFPCFFFNPARFQPRVPGRPVGPGFKTIIHDLLWIRSCFPIKNDIQWSWTCFLFKKYNLSYRHKLNKLVSFQFNTWFLSFTLFLQLFTIFPHLFIPEQYPLLLRTSTLLLNSLLLHPLQYFHAFLPQYHLSLKIIRHVWKHSLTHILKKNYFFA